MTKIKDEYFDIPPRKIATIVTHLEMHKPAHLRSERQLDKVALNAIETPRAAWYQALYKHVGAHNWLWFSRLQLPDTELEAIVQHPDVEVYAMEHRGSNEGLLELDFRKKSVCELAFIGVTANLIGQGFGRFLMNRAIEIAWRREIRRLHVHTCTLDHPSALTFYMRSGFHPVRQQMQIADDPRLTGLLPDSSAPQVPIFR